MKNAWITSTPVVMSSDPRKFDHECYTRRHYGGRVTYSVRCDDGVVVRCQSTRPIKYILITDYVAEVGKRVQFITVHQSFPAVQRHQKKYRSAKFYLFRASEGTDLQPHRCERI